MTIPNSPSRDSLISTIFNLLSLFKPFPLSDSAAVGSGQPPSNNNQLKRKTPEDATESPAKKLRQGQ